MDKTSEAYKRNQSYNVDIDHGRNNSIQDLMATFNWAEARSKSKTIKKRQELLDKIWLPKEQDEDKSEYFDFEQGRDISMAKKEYLVRAEKRVEKG